MTMSCREFGADDVYESPADHRIAAAARDECGAMRVLNEYRA